MKTISRNLLLLAMVSLMIGCSTPQTERSEISEFVLPECDYVSDKLVRQFDEAKNMFNTVAVTGHGPVRAKPALMSDEAFWSELRPFLKAAGAEGEVDKIMTDPFWMETLPTVHFGTSIPGREVAEYYQAVFENAGWKKGRGIFPLMEGTLCGGDWLQVFVRGDKMVLVHVCGQMEKLPGEAKGEVRWRTIILQFRGLAPEELLGQGFRNIHTIPMPPLPGSKTDLLNATNATRAKSKEH